MQNLDARIIERDQSWILEAAECINLSRIVSLELALLFIRGDADAFKKVLAEVSVRRFAPKFLKSCRVCWCPRRYEEDGHKVL